MKLKTRKITFLLLISVVTLTSCNLINQITQTMQLVNCKFNLDNVNKVRIANVDISRNHNLSIADVTNLATSLLRGTLPLTMNINMGINNPGEQTARLGSFDWICAIDGQDMASGTVNNTYNIPAKQTTKVPVSLSVDIFELFSDEGIDAVKRFVNSFSNQDNMSSRVAIKIRPSIMVGNQNLHYPGYITLEKNFK